MTTDLTAQDIEDLKRLEKAATPPGWVLDYSVVHGERYSLNGVVIDKNSQSLVIEGSGGACSFTDYIFIAKGTRQDEDNYRFIVTARNAMPRLLAMVERLQGDQLTLDEIQSVQARTQGALDEENATLRRQIAAKDAEIERLNGDVAELRALDNEAQHGADDMRDELATLRRQIAERDAALRRLVDAESLSGVRDLVAEWNGENKPQPYKERHPSKLGATLPKTNCGAVYALDEAMQAARAILEPKP